MSKIRVLVVDDAVVIRKMITDALASDPEIELVGTAANGKIALAKISQVNPDLVTMDVEMPEMDGLTTLRELRKSHPRLPVIMFSTLTARGAETTLDALAAGANDYVTKPANVGSVAVGLTRIREELIPKVKALCGRVIATPMPEVPRRVVVPTVRQAASPIKLVVIGVSTGGPNALAQIIPALPGNLPVPVMIVQHMPPVFTRLLGERLNQQSPLTVKEAVHGEPIKLGCVYIAPGDYHMGLAGGKVVLDQNPPENSCRPAVDVLFRSAAKTAGTGVLGIILTGMGQDGFRGAQAIVEAGGHVLAQDQATSVVWGMPSFVTKAGLAEQILPLNRVATEIVQRVMGSRMRATA
jgi:two-component system, chemotaxis family, protein-glutamate methylesterase/glutaminase